jgi:putative membrane protein
MKHKNSALSSGVLLAFVGAASSAMAEVGETPGSNTPYYHGHDMMWGGSQWSGFGMVLGPVFMMLIVLGIIAGIVYLFKMFGGSGLGASHAAHDRALVLLKERYAKGEIDTEEFSERKKQLLD